MTIDLIEQRRPDEAARLLSLPPRESALPRESAPHHRSAAPEVRLRIGGHLRHLYADVLWQPLPERLATLLDALAAVEIDPSGRQD